jgi:hypothetical protein
MWPFHRSKEMCHTDVRRATGFEPDVASTGTTSVACSSWATVLVACALCHVTSDTIAPPIMNVAMKANVEGDRTDGTAHCHNAAMHNADTVSAANMPRKPELGLVKGTHLPDDQHLVDWLNRACGWRAVL